MMPRPCVMFWKIKALHVKISASLQAMARLWRVAHFVLSDFLNLSLDEASSSTLSEASHMSSMAQVGHCS